jgi:hypothetical protein
MSRFTKEKKRPTQENLTGDWLDTIPFTSTPLKKLTDKQVDYFVDKFTQQNLAEIKWKNSPYPLFTPQKRKNSPSNSPALQMGIGLIVTAINQHNKDFFIHLKSSPEFLKELNNNPKFSITHLVLTHYDSEGKTKIDLDFMRFLLDQDIINPFQKTENGTYALDFARERVICQKPKNSWKSMP